MTADHSADYLINLVRELCRLPAETEWLEFKHNNADPQEIGEYVSALSNAAAINGKAFAYVIWGVDDQTHEVLGTTFSPSATKKGNEPLETWLLRLLTPKIHFRFHEITMDGHAIAMLEIARAYRHPVRFQGDEFIRIGPVKKPLKEAPDRERLLWRIFDQTPFEDLIAVEHTTADEVLRLLDYPAYFDVIEQPLPANRDGIISALADDGLIQSCDAGGWNITNLGAILFAKRLDDFRTLRRKAIRVIRYDGHDRTARGNELPETGRGYAAGFAGLTTAIANLIPPSETKTAGLRIDAAYPPLALRELVANALIHQDFLVNGASPMVEIFDDRIEITNPGAPLVDVARFLDKPPRTRNEALAAFLRRIGVCEERGSGIDLVVRLIEDAQLPAPLIEAPGDNTRVTIFAHRPLARMEQADRVRACYLHACLRYVRRDYLTNTSLRERFGMTQAQTPVVSRLIREAVDAGAIVPQDAEAAPKLMRYVPAWAKGTTL